MTVSWIAEKNESVNQPLGTAQPWRTGTRGFGIAPAACADERDPCGVSTGRFHPFTGRYVTGATT